MIYPANYIRQKIMAGEMEIDFEGEEGSWWFLPRLFSAQKSREIHLRLNRRWRVMEARKRGIYAIRKAVD